MKYLGIDYGTKKIGLAVSDDGGTIAFPHEVIANDVELEANIHGLIQNKGIEAVVVGESTDFKGKDNVIAEQAHAFAEVLKETMGIEVHFEPEFLTTKQARNVPRGENPRGTPASPRRSERYKEEPADAAAAALILQSFLDRLKN